MRCYTHVGQRSCQLLLRLLRLRLLRLLLQEENRNCQSSTFLYFCLKEAATFRISPKLARHMTAGNAAEQQGQRSSISKSWLNTPQMVPPWITGTKRGPSEQQLWRWVSVTEDRWEGYERLGTRISIRDGAASFSSDYFQQKEIMAH